VKGSKIDFEFAQIDNIGFELVLKTDEVATKWAFPKFRN